MGAFLAEQVKANRIPGTAVALVQGDQIIFNQGYGEAEPGKAVTPQTQFYIGSTAKSFTALAVMQLVEQGKLGLDAPVQQYLPWFKVADADASATITVRHLLNHTSGLSETGDPNAAAVTSTLEEQGRLLQYVRLTAPVGTRYQYYNQNYRLLGLLIETVSEQTFGDYLQAHIFEPLGMANTTADPARAVNLAQGYGRVFGFALPRTQPFNPGGLPSGYLISTAEDMAKFLLAQNNNTKADGSQLLDPRLLAEMRILPAGIETEYGMGWMVMENGNMLIHGGMLDYFQSFIMIRPQEKLGMVILFNQTSAENLMLENNAIRSGLLNLLDGKAPQETSYGWVGWLLLFLAAADLFNHARLFSMLPQWAQKTVGQNRLWPWVKIAAGIAVPLLVTFGVPALVKSIQGGSPSWAEPLRLAPDLTAWLLAGMSLDLIRGVLRGWLLLRRVGPAQR